MRHLLLFVLVILTACSSQPEQKRVMTDTERSAEYQRTRYQVSQDFSPLLLLKSETIRDAIPREEPIRKAGNKSPYTVLGKTYSVLSQDQAKTYKDRGGASWYGLKFHGHKTSNGETYSIYGMTAAHKTLPIPSYVKVTNVANGKQVIVRVNDRGPFHEGRIIDLSYAAATKLEYIGFGTAEVIVEALDASRWSKVQPKSDKKASVVLQIAALSSRQKAESIQKDLQKKLDATVYLESAENNIVRIKVGPLSSYQADLLSEKIITLGFAPPIRIKLEK